VADGRVKGPRTVSEFVTTLTEPTRSQVQLLREIILGVSPAIGEEIRWNVLPRGRRRGSPWPLTWLPPARAIVTFTGLEHLSSERASFEELVRDWIPYVPQPPTGGEG